MVRLRFQRVGRPHQPHFRLVAIHGTKARDAASLEVIGHYHPKETDMSNKVTVDSERLKYWLSQGAQPSDTVRSVLKTAGVWNQAQAAS
jgi:small subunit ribosomal protein S16